MGKPGDKCGRCAASVNDPSWWCLHCAAALCNQCGDDFGHCGHPKANEMTRTPVEADNYNERDRLVKQLARIMKTIAPPKSTPPRSKQLLN